LGQNPTTNPIKHDCQYNPSMRPAQLRQSVKIRRQLATPSAIETCNF